MVRSGFFFRNGGKEEAGRFFIWIEVRRREILSGVIVSFFSCVSVIGVINLIWW